ncbi:MAG TPA: hypothetical protein V6D28_08160 [Leptolyngbyaceae cyanobacterium]
MQPHSSVSQWCKRLICGTYAFALVSSLSIYHKTVLANPLTLVERHWRSIATENSFLTKNQYCANAIVMWKGRRVDAIYRGKEIHQFWQQFFQENKIQQFQVIQQPPPSVKYSWSNWGQDNLLSKKHIINAAITIRALPEQGPVKVFSIFYQVQFNPEGKIIYEVWQAYPELTV